MHLAFTSVTSKPPAKQLCTTRKDGYAEEATKAARPASASSQRAKAEAAHRKVMARREAESKVRACYFRFAGNCDVAAFMQALGYDMAHSKDASPAALFYAAVKVSARRLRVLQPCIGRECMTYYEKHAGPIFGDPI